MSQIVGSQVGGSVMGGSVIQPTYEQLVMSMNPTSHWAMDELAGPTGFDMAGLHDGAYVGGATLFADPGMIVGGIPRVKFNSVNDNSVCGLTIPNSTDYDFTAGGGIACWIRLDGSTFFWLFVDQWENNPPFPGWNFGGDNGTPTGLLYVARTTVSGAEFLIDDLELRDGAVHMIGMTQDASKVVRLWVDGVLAASASFTVFPEANPGGSRLFIDSDWQPINTRQNQGAVTIWQGTANLPGAAEFAALYARGIAP